LQKPKFQPRSTDGKLSLKKMRFRECQFTRINLLAVLLLGLSLLFASACSSEATKQKHLTRGEEFLQKRKFRQAVMEFRAAADIDKNSAEAHYGLARAHENLGEVYEAIKELQEVAQLAPANTDAKARLGNYFLLIAPPQTDEAQKMIDEIFAVNPNFVEGYILKASLLSAQNKSEAQILEVLNRAVEIEPSRVETYISLARFFMKQEKAPEAEQTIQKAIAVNEKSPVGYIEYGRFYDFTNRPAEAEAQVKKAVDAAPQNYEARQASASFYLAQRNLEKAEQAYKDLAQVLGNSAEGLTELAEFYVAVGREEDAIQTFQAILNDAPEHAPARYRLAEIYLERKETAKVGEQVEKLLAVNNTDAEALMLRARVKLQENSTEDAIKDLEEVLKRQPSFKSALFYMAQARLALGQVDQARAFIGDLEKYHPNYLSSRILKIQASFTANEPQKALQEANELIEIAKTAYPTAETSAQQLEQLRVRAISSRGLAYIELGKLAEARADLEEIVKLSPNSANAFVNLAKVSAAQKNLAEALSFYEKALAIDRQNFDALSGAVSVLTRQKQFAAAHEKLDKAIAENASDKKLLPAFHYLKADVFRSENNLPASESELSKAIELDDTYLPAYSAYAALLISQNQSERAIEQYKKVVEKKQSASVYTLIGMLEDARGNPDEAEKNYRKALEIAPEMPIAANNLAWNIADKERGNLDEALTLAQNCVDRNSANAGFYDTLGWVYFKKGLLSPAVEQLKKAVSLEDTDAQRSGRAANPAYRLRLGQALASAGDKPSARKEVELALQQEKDLTQKEVQDAKSLLSSL
jgi:tetratricopeptide (TPR) repeat protein